MNSSKEDLYHSKPHSQKNSKKMKMILFIKITLLLALNWKLALEVYAEIFDSCNPKNTTHSILLEVLS